MSYETILVETKGRVGIIRLNRPQALNALNSALNAELARAIAAFDADDGVGCILITGSEKAFAAGADIKEMADKSAVEVFMGDFAAGWHARRERAQAGDRRGRGLRARRRLRAGRCNATSSSPPTPRSSASPRSSSASFPGIGGTQRLPRAVGKAKAMDLILTGRMMDAAEAERAGLVVARGAGGEPDGRGDEGRRDDRRDVAAGADRRQGGGQPRVRDAARRRRALRAARVSRAVRHRRTRRKAWPRSSRSGRRSSSTSERSVSRAKRSTKWCAADPGSFRTREPILISSRNGSRISVAPLPLRSTLRRVRDTRPQLPPHANHAHHRRSCRVDAGAAGRGRDVLRVQEFAGWWRPARSSPPAAPPRPRSRAPAPSASPCRRCGPAHRARRRRRSRAAATDRGCRR